jgi:hypothetical protein
VTGSLVDLPARAGARPRTTPSNPHTQLDQQPDDDRPRRLLEERFAQLLPGVVWRPSMISVPGARAMTLPADAAQGPPEAFMVGTEFAHLHPAPDHSLHLVLPPAVASRVVEAGWAEQHPVARRGLITSGAVLVYAPRDEEEAELVSRIVTASFEYARERSGLTGREIGADHHAHPRARPPGALGPRPGSVPAVLPRRARVERDPRGGAPAGPRGGVLFRTHPPRAVADRGGLGGGADASGAPCGAVPVRAEGRRQRRRPARGRASPDRARGADPGASDHTVTHSLYIADPDGHQIEFYVDVMATEE